MLLGVLSKHTFFFDRVLLGPYTWEAGRGGEAVSETEDKLLEFTAFSMEKLRLESISLFKVLKWPEITFCSYQISECSF